MVILANGIDLPMLLAWGLAIILPLLLLNAVVEAPVLAKFLGVRWRDLFSPLLKANMWSLLAGLPVAMLNAMVAQWLLPEEFVARMNGYPLVIGLWYVNYYLATVLVEYVWFRRLIREQLADLGKPLLKGILLANLASYAVLVPLYWWQAQPRHSIKEFTHHTQWARQPATEVAFVNPGGTLSAIRTDGSNLRSLLTNQVRDFVIAEDLRTVLFRSGSNEYFLALGDQVRRINAPPLTVLGMAMDFSPDGEVVALAPCQSTLIYVWDRSSGRVASSPSPVSGDSFARLCWSTNRNTFYLATGKLWHEVTLRGVSSLSCEMNALGTNGPPPVLARHYARLGQGITTGGEGPEPNFDYFSLPKEDAWSAQRSYAGGGISARHKNKHLQVSENPGLLHIGGRQFPQVGFTSSYDELVFHDGRNIYLADMDQQRVGRLAPGNSFVLIAPACSKAESPCWQ